MAQGASGREILKNKIGSETPPQAVPVSLCELYPKKEPSIWKRPGQRRWMQWTSPLTDGQILGVMSDDGRGLLRGCYWGETTRHAVLDIDNGSEYHSSQALTKLLQEFEGVGLTFVPYRSSESQGWHLYCYFDSAVLSQEVERTIKNYLRACRYEIRSGTLEVFPSGNALRLPLQAGFGWLDAEGNLEVSREELTEGQALVLFFNDIEENKRNWSEAKSRIESAIGEIERAAGAGVQEHEKAISNEGFEDFYQKGLDWEKWQRGRDYWASGLTSKSQRHDALLCVGHYLWYGDLEAGVIALPGQRNKALRAAQIETWLKEKHNGLSEDINRGRGSEVRGDIERATSWTRQNSLVKEYEPYRITDRMIDRLVVVPYLGPEDLKLANERREEGARRKIKKALEKMLTEGEHPTVKNLVKATGCRRETVKRHFDIWHIHAVHPSTLGMSKGLGDYIAGGHGGTCGSLQLALSSGSSGSISQIVLFESQESFFNSSTFRDQGVEPTCIESFDQRESFEAFTGSEVALSFSPEGKGPDDEPVGKVFHDLKIALLSENDVKACAGSCELAPIFMWCLTPYAATLRGDGEQLNGKSYLRLLPPPLPASLATGSSTGALTCKAETASTCGLNGFPPTRCAGPSHLNPRDFCMALCARSCCRSRDLRAIFSKGARARNLTARAEVWYADATKCGIGAMSAASSETGALVSFRDRRKEKPTIIDATNDSILTTVKTSYWSQWEDKICGAVPGGDFGSSAESPPVASSSDAAWFRLGSSKQAVDSSFVPLSELINYTKVPFSVEWIMCRQPLGYLLLELVNCGIRAVPFADSS